VKRAERTTELIVTQAYEESPGELSSKNPMILSCGGIYIPYNRRKIENRKLWHIINTADENSPSKVVCEGLPQSPLAEILNKESLN